MRRLEEDLIEDFKVFGYAGGISPKSDWIREHLAQVGQDYALQMFKKYSVFVEEARLRGAKIRPSKQATFVSYVYLLRHLKLLESVKPYTWAPAKRHYLKLNPKMVDSPLWQNPRLKKYPLSWKRAEKKPKPLGRRPSGQSQDDKIRAATDSS